MSPSWSPVRPIHLECSWTNPETLAAAWTVAKGVGGTLDYRHVEDMMHFTVSFTAPREVIVLDCGIEVKRIPRLSRVTIDFRFSVIDIKPGPGAGLTVREESP